MLKTVCAKSSSVTLNYDSSSLALLRKNAKHLLSVRTAGESFLKFTVHPYWPHLVSSNLELHNFKGIVPQK